MSNWDEIGFAQQGWQCPVCGAVYSPLTMQCFNCTGWKVSNKDSTSTGDADIDMFRKYLNHSVPKPVEEREKAICKEICDFIRGGCSTDTDEDKNYVCHEIQKIFYRT